VTCSRAGRVRLPGRPRCLANSRPDGIFKSNVHRASNSSGAERYSIPLFFGTDYDVRLEVGLPSRAGCQIRLLKFLLDGTANPVVRVKGTADAVRSYHGGRVRQSKGGGDLWAQVRYVDRTAFENEVPSLFLTPAAGSSYLTDMYIQPPAKWLLVASITARSLPLGATLSPARDCCLG
jgi:hypothetical protein